jgi:hypothetical protein
MLFNNSAWDVLVFFTSRYLVLGELRLVRRTITDGDEIYTGSGP